MCGGQVMTALTQKAGFRAPLDSFVLKNPAHRQSTKRYGQA
jgi:hypothetical protein